MCTCVWGQSCRLEYTQFVWKKWIIWLIFSIKFESRCHWKSHIWWFFIILRKKSPCSLNLNLDVTFLIKIFLKTSNIKDFLIHRLRARPPEDRFWKIVLYFLLDCWYYSDDEFVAIMWKAAHFNQQTYLHMDIKSFVVLWCRYVLQVRNYLNLGAVG